MKREDFLHDRLHPRHVKYVLPENIDHLDAVQTLTHDSDSDGDVDDEDLPTHSSFMSQ